jgi:hypothetical protein
MGNEKHPRRGRPSRAQASRKALRGVDPSSVDPRDVLREIAADRSAPATARVAAARALIADAQDREIREANSKAW